MTTMEISTAAVAGHSLGGAVALEFSLDFPERTAGLILIASGGYPREDMPGALNLLVLPLQRWRRQPRPRLTCWMHSWPRLLRLRRQAILLWRHQCPSMHVTTARKPQAFTFLFSRVGRHIPEPNKPQTPCQSLFFGIT
jgi:pimeloyl-ACP methyl ester carboxylesterase